MKLTKKLILFLLAFLLLISSISLASGEPIATSENESQQDTSRK